MKPLASATRTAVSIPAYRCPARSSTVLVDALSRVRGQPSSLRWTSRTPRPSAASPAARERSQDAATINGGA